LESTIKIQNEDDKDDAEWEDLDVKSFVCDVHEKTNKINMVPYVTFNEACSERCASHLFEENFGIDKVKVDILVL